MVSRVASGYNVLTEFDDDDDKADSPLTGPDGTDDSWGSPSSQHDGQAGHFVSSPTAAQGPTQRAGSGALSSTPHHQRQGSGGLRGWAAYFRDKSSQASSTPASAETAQERAKGTAGRLQKQATKGWQQAREATVSGYKKLTGGPLAGLCRGEALSQPCPRAVLVCCSALVCGGLATEGLFSKGQRADPDAVHWLLGGLRAGAGVTLPAAESTPHVIAAALTQWLLTLEEPLLTYRLLPEFIAAGKDAPLRGTTVMQQLPTANFNCLQVLLEMWHRLAAHFAINGMDARSIAQNVVPSLAWHPPPPSSQQQSYMTLASDAHPQSASNLSDDEDREGDATGAFGPPGPRTDLSSVETQALIKVIERMIESFSNAVSHRDKGIYQGPAF